MLARDVAQELGQLGPERAARSSPAIAAVVVVAGTEHAARAARRGGSNLDQLAGAGAAVTLAGAVLAGLALDRR